MADVTIDLEAQAPVVLDIEGQVVFPANVVGGNGIAVTREGVDYVIANTEGPLPGPEGPTGPAGPTGPTGATGPTGLTGPIGAPAVEVRNRILNPAMQINQAGTGTAAIVSGSYFLDGWLTFMVLSGGAATVGSVPAINPSGSQTRARITVTTGKTLAAGEYLIFSTKMEGVEVADLLLGNAAAKPFTARFGFKGPAGTYSAAFRNTGTTRLYTVAFTIAAGAANTDTTQTFTVPGDVTGTWDASTGLGLELLITLAAASNQLITGGAWTASSALAATGQSGAVANGAVFEIFDVGLYAGSAAPPFDVPRYADELRRCQRYWQKSYAGALAPGANTGLASGIHDAISAASSPLSVRLAQSMRVAPAILVYDAQGTANTYTINGTSHGQSPGVVDNQSEIGFKLFSNATAQTRASFHWTANARL